MEIDDKAFMEEKERSSAVVHLADIMFRLGLNDFYMIARVHCGDNMNSHELSITSNGKIWETHCFDTNVCRYNTIYTEWDLL